MSVELAEVRNFLAQHEPFLRLPDADLAQLPAKLTIRYVRRGEVVVHTGDINDTLHIIRAGAIDIIGSDGELLDRREQGLTFGYSTLNGQPVSRYCMKAVEDCLVFELGREDFAELCSRHPDIDRYFSALTTRIRRAAEGLGDPSVARVLRTKIDEVMIATPCTIAPDESIRAAARKMTEREVSSLLVTDEGTLQGIITDRDIRSRVVAAGMSAENPVTQAMSPDPWSVPSSTLAMEALLTMSEKRIHHLPVIDDGELNGIVTQADIARLLHNDPIFLATDVSHRDDVDSLAESLSRVATLSAQYIDRGAAPQESAAMLTIAADAIARRLFVLGEQKFGAAPVDYAFVAVGSQGRREMGLASDQDNALVLADDFDPDVDGEYFQHLTQFVCTGLEQVGQSLCPGDMMAMNPKWRMTVSQWGDTFNSWVTAPEPEALLNSQVFFDFRTVYGNAELGEQVHRTAIVQGQGSRRLHAHLASLAARREPPLTLFRGLVVDRSGQYARTLDVKKGGTASIVQMARLYGLSAGVEAVGTRERLLQSAGDAVSRRGAQDLIDAFDFLRALSLKHQSAQLKAGSRPDYLIDPKLLSRMDREHLRDAFQIIKNMQNALATKYPVRNI